MPAHMPETLRRLWTVALGLLILLGLADADAADKPKVSQKQVFSCNFKTELSKRWRMIGGKWELQDGYLRQLDPRPADPTKAILVMGNNCDEVSHDVSVVARLRLDAWKDGEWARAGISVCSDPTTGHGLNLVFHRGRLEFLHDYVVWGSGVEFPYQSGTWYWMKLCKQGGQVKGKAWRDGDPQPADWMITWRIPVPAVTGYPALVGGSGGPGDDICTVSFARCDVLLGDIPFGYYTKRSTWHETMAASRAALARQETALSAKLSAKLPDQTGIWLRTGLWKSLRRDFADPASLGQMAAEQQDKILTEDWPFDRVDVLAQPYANATGAGLTRQARELAKIARTNADLERVRKLYHHAKQIEHTLAGWKDSRLKSLRLAVEDLTATYGSRYAKGPQYLKHVAKIEKTIADVRLTADGAVRLFEAAKQFEALCTEALLANPLLDFDSRQRWDRTDPTPGGCTTCTAT